VQISDLDPSCPFFSQLDQAGEDPVTVINTFVAPEGGMDACLEAWKTEAAVMKAQPGFISTQLYRGVGDSRILTNVAVWESAAALKAAFSSRDWQDGLLNPPEGAVAYPVLMRKMGTPGICVA
jgi:heme-degrading monooxygenase HmoA